MPRNTFKFGEHSHEEPGPLLPGHYVRHNPAVIGDFVMKNIEGSNGLLWNLAMHIFHNTATAAPAIPTHIQINLISRID